MIALCPNQNYSGAQDERQREEERRELRERFEFESQIQ